MTLELARLSKSTISTWVLSSKHASRTLCISLYLLKLVSHSTITFIDENRRFVTTSDDKSIRAWDFGIPVVIKYIAEPYMHSVPAVGVHPSNKWLAMQSLDNQILIYSSPELKQNRKKRFAGHTVAGYACEVGFSPDGKFISSGTGDGSLVMWDFRTGRLLKRLQAHSKAVITHTWLPHETVSEMFCVVSRTAEKAPFYSQKSSPEDGMVLSSCGTRLCPVWVFHSPCHLSRRVVVTLLYRNLSMASFSLTDFEWDQTCSGKQDALVCRRLCFR